MNPQYKPLDDYSDDPQNPRPDSSRKGKVIAALYGKYLDYWEIQKTDNGALWLTGNDIDWNVFQVIKSQTNPTGCTLLGQSLILSAGEQIWTAGVAEERWGE